jgi:predicted small secreted protein
MIMKRIFALVLLVLLLATSGCECISGFGRDMQKAGKWVEKEAAQKK